MPDIPDIGFAVNLAPEKAIEYFRRKGWSISFRWQDTLRDAQAHAFTVAGAMRADVLSSIRGELTTALQEGRTFTQFKKDIEPTLKKLGWWGRTEITDPTTGEVRQIDVTPWRLRNIYRTNMQTSYMAGRYKFNRSITDRRPFWQYVAIIDASTRPSHEARNGTVLPADDPWWDVNHPPNGWGCRCRPRTLSRRALDRRGLKVSDGSDLTDVAEKGWKYNPGKAALYDPAQLDPNLFPVQRTWRDYGRPDLRDVPDDDKLQAQRLPAAGSLDEAHSKIADTFGVSEAEPVRYIDTPAGQVLADYRRLRHPARARTETRERYAGYALSTLEDPYEVYLTRFDDGQYRKQYIGVFTGRTDVLVSVVPKQDGSLLWNFFQAADKDMNKNRRGDALLFAK